MDGVKENGRKRAAPPRIEKRELKDEKRERSQRLRSPWRDRESVSEMLEKKGEQGGGGGREGRGEKKESRMHTIEKGELSSGEEK